METIKKRSAVGYVRISTTEEKQKHSIDHQKEKIRMYAELIDVKLKKIVVEKASGRKMGKRPLLQEVITENKQELVICTKIDRLARNIVDLNQIVHSLQKNARDVAFVENQIDTGSANGKLFLNILGSFAEFEGEIISERTKAGLETARKKGIKLGRPKLKSTITGEKVERIRALRKGKKSWGYIAKEFGYKSRAGVYKFWMRNR